MQTFLAVCKEMLTVVQVWENMLREIAFILGNWPRCLVKVFC